jgi:hypothetical protein
VTVTSFIRGWPVVWVLDAWCWADTMEPAAGWGGAERPCPWCHLIADPNDGKGGVDPCLGVLPDVASACCGHGTRDGWIGAQRSGVRLRVTVDQSVDPVREATA